MTRGTKVDPIDDLLVAELDEANRKLGSDVVNAIQKATVDRWQALALVAWLHARRQDPKARLEPFRQMRVTELTALLGYDDADDQADTAGAGDDQVDVVDDNPQEAIAADPTAPAPASS